MATYYVDSALGDDGDAGTIAAPWQTLAKVNATALAPGSTVRFKRGESWHGQIKPISSGASDMPITFTDYGIGDLPIISLIARMPGTDVAESWVDFGATVANTWYIDLPFGGWYPYRVYMDDIEYDTPATFAEVDANLRWATATILGVPNRLLVYSVANPSSILIEDCGIVEFGNSTATIHVLGKHHITFKNLDVRGGWNCAIATDGSKHITFQDCAIGYRSLNGMGTQTGQNDYFTVSGCTIDAGVPNWGLIEPYPPTLGTGGMGLHGGDYASIHDNTFSGGWRHTDLEILPSNPPGAEDVRTNNCEVYGNTHIANDVIYNRAFSCGAYLDGNCSHNDIHDNTYINFPVHIQFGGDYNKFRNNTIIGVPRTEGAWNYETGRGIAISAGTCICHHCEVTDNTFTDCSGEGLMMWSAGAAYPLNNNIIDGNIFTNCGANPFDPTHTGVAVVVADVDFYDRDNTYSNNVIMGHDSDARIYYRGAFLTVAEFNAAAEFFDVISGNTTSLTVVPPEGASSSLLGLIGLVSAELENHTALGSWQAVGDGTTTSFTVAPLARYIVDDDTWAVDVGGAETTEFTMDFDSGVITLDTAPALSVPLTGKFNHAYWTDELVAQAVNAGINNLFPAFYVPKADTSIPLVADTYEYALPPEAQFITAVETRADATGAYTKMARSKYEWLSDGDHLNLRFFSAPTGFMRVRCINRPSPLVDSSDTLETTAGLPARAKDPIISYACWYLLTQKIAPRIRSDIAVNTQGVGTLSPRQINDGVQAWMMRYQLQVAANKMVPWMSR